MKARRKTLSFYKEDVRRQNSAEVPRRFPLELCRMLHIKTLEASAEVLRYKGHQGFAYAPLSVFGTDPRFLEESKHRPMYSQGRLFGTHHVLNRLPARGTLGKVDGVSGNGRPRSGLFVSGTATQ